MEAKKNPKLDFRKKRGLFFNIGLVTSLALVLMAFEWKTPTTTSEVPFVYTPDEMEIMDEVKQTVIPPPPKPKVQVFTLNPVEDDEEVIDIKIDIPEPDIEVIDEPVFVEKMPDEEVEKVFDIVETDPSFMDGGQAKFLQYVGSKLRYPNQARRMGIEGKVYVQFIVDKNGKMTDIQVVRGLGAGCDEEVLRVLNNAPAWEPGKQRGNPVKVRMIIPVAFQLN